MTETRAAQLRTVLLAAMLLFLATASTLPVQAQAPEPTNTDTAMTEQDDSANVDDMYGEPEGECLPPSTQEWVLIGAGTLAVFVFCFFLLVRLMERYYIRRDKNATLGRHLGISLAFLVSSLGMVGLAYLVTGCLHHQFLVWLCFPLALWLIHLIYTLAVARNE